MNINKQQENNQQILYNPHICTYATNILKLAYKYADNQQDIFLIDEKQETHNTTTLTKVKEYVYPSNRIPVLRISIEVKVSGGVGSLRIYKNGIWCHSLGNPEETEYTTKYKTLINFAEGDLIQVYVNIQPPGGETIYVRNFRLIGNSYIRPVIPHIIS